MKPVPAVLLLATVLLTTHLPLSVCRPRDLSVFDGRGYQNRLDELLLRSGDSAVSFLTGDKLLQYLERKTPVSRSPYERQDGGLEELLDFSKRSEEPPISIDLTFHLLRNMIEMARIENQREQAELNRKYLDEVGK